MTKRLIRIRDDLGQPKTLGYVKGDTLFMWRDRSKHFFRKLNGWGIDKIVAEGLADVTFFKINTKNGRGKGNTAYTISREHFLERAEEIHYDGHRSQLVVPESEWESEVWYGE